jgi:SAM-dependent methyltransferase
MNDMPNFYSRNTTQFIKQYEQIQPEKVHKDWLHFIPTTKSLILDIGSGSGRDAAWLAGQGHEVIAVEPADGLRQKAQELHPQPSIQWLKDTLPSLKEIYKLGLKFDLILLSAVWMHIPPGERERAFRKVANLLKPGGALVITLRHGPSPDERVMYPQNSLELRHLANRFALEVVLDTHSEDHLGRSEVSWSTVVLWLPDDGTGALPLLRHVIVNDPKSSTYKLALLRVLLRMADGSQGMILEQDEDNVTLPFGLVALYWVRQFKRLVLDMGYLQQPSGSGKLGFDREAFRALAAISPYDLRIGSRFEGEAAENLVVALRDARNIIKRMPAFHTTYPNSREPVFPCTSKQIRPRSSVKLDTELLAEFGTFTLPRNLWDAMTRYACWIEPAILNEWCTLMAGYESGAGKQGTVDEYMRALSWLDEERDTREVRTIFEDLRAQGTRIRCVWTDKALTKAYHIDHCFPFAHWPNNDLWNLMPAHPMVNNRKSSKLPSAGLLEEARDRIFEWWVEAYSPERYSERFVSEATAALPVVRTLTVKNQFDRVFAGIQNQRIRLKTDQQIAEWDGL